jgi:hypothetical protein
MFAFELDTQNNIQFEMDITGHVDSPPKVEFRIISEAMNVSFPAKQTGSIYEVTIEPLEKIIPAGLYTCEICVYMGNRFFVPIQETVEFVEKVVPKIKNFTVNKISAQPPTITIESVVEKAPAETPVKTGPKIIFRKKGIQQ